MRSAKRLLLLLVVPLLAALLPSCSEDFKVNAPYRNITVVYGLLNMSDTAHYIRIQKAFLDENRSALDIARQYDSNFYAALDVHLKEISNGSVIADETLSRVDLNNERFYQKDTGAFFNTPSYAYKTIRLLNPDNTYRLVIHNAVTGETDSSETPIISNAGNAFRVPTFIQGYQLDFQGFYPNDKLEFKIIPPANAPIFDGIIRFHYVNVNGSTRTNDSVDYQFASGIPLNDEQKLSVEHRSIQAFLVSAIGAPPSSNTYRLIGRADIFIWAGATDFATYQTINGVQGGLTADQIRPIYTNIKGANTFGLFSSRTYRAAYGIKINDQTLDTLIMGVIPRPLNIRGRSD